MLTFFVAKTNVFAGSLSIWASASNVTVGQNVTISVKVNNLAGKFDVTSSNQSILAGGTNSTWMENDTYTFQFTAKSEGKVTVTATAIDEVGDFDTNSVFWGSKSVTLNVIPKKSFSNNGTTGSSSNQGGTTADKKEYSNDNNLSSLSVEGYTITPAYQTDVTEYKLAVDENVEKINVIAKANHDKASVSGIGEVSLSSGENTLEIKVTAENGNEKIYKLLVTVEDQHPIPVKINKKQYTVVKKNNDLIDKLEYYEETTIKIDDQDVVAYTNPKTKVTLVLLKDEDNKIDYYIYNMQKKEYSPYHYIKVQGVTLQLLDSTEVLKNYTKYQLKIQNETVTIYKLKSSHKMGLIYGTNVKTGNTDYYVYDQEEETLSRYFDEELKLYQADIQNLKNYLMIFMGIVAFTMIITIIISLHRGQKKKKMKIKS